MLAIFIVLMIIIVFLVRKTNDLPDIEYEDKRDCGVKHANVIYSDEEGCKMLVSRELELRGKPDMIFETKIGKELIPLEIKSGTLKDEMPHQGDLYQLYIYFILVEECYNKRPPYGKLVYANKTFTVRNTKACRQEAMEIVDDMRSMLDGEYEPECEPSFSKCRYCVARATVCQFAKEAGISTKEDKEMIEKNKALKKKKTKKAIKEEKVLKEQIELHNKMLQEKIKERDEKLKHQHDNIDA